MKKLSTLFLLFSLFYCVKTSANNFRISNVGFTNNNPSTQTVSIRFTLSWENSWKDSINWDAAWVFAKFKNPSTGLWLPLKFVPLSGANGTGITANIQVTNDSLGAFIYRSNISSGNFIDSNITINWKYGTAGISSLAGLEFRLMGMEMVYIPQGQFQLTHNESVTKYADYLRNASNRDSTTYPKGSFPRMRIFGSNYVIPTIDTNSVCIESVTWGEREIGNSYKGFSVPNDTFCIKGGQGIDINRDGVIDNNNYPTGYNAFYMMKYEMSEQQYADFLNTLTSVQVSNLGVAGRNISLVNGLYLSSTPNRSCSGAINNRFFAYADWSALRPMSFMEFDKAHRGPISAEFDISYEEVSNISLWSPNWSPNASYFQNENGTETLLSQLLQSFPRTDSSYLISYGFQSVNGNYNFPRSGVFGRSNSTRKQIVATYYGVIDLISNTSDQYISLKNKNFTTINGNGLLDTGGYANVSNWSGLNAFFCIDGRIENTQRNNEMESNPNDTNGYLHYIRGFRFVRSAE
jgi:hypothetical protein